jgi:hypothetical protein
MLALDQPADGKTAVSIILIAMAAAAQAPRIPSGVPAKAVVVNAAENVLRVLPPDNPKWGYVYAPLTPLEISAVDQVAKAVVSGPHPNPLLVRDGLMHLPWFYISDTLPNGLQRMQKGENPVQQMPTAGLSCEFAPPASLGELGDQKFAVVKVTCAINHPLYREFKLGMTLRKNRVTAVALNLGDDANLFPNP